jgi:ankyrin repeat protein
MMHYASHRGHTESVEALVQAKADVCAQNKDGHTPLDLAEMRGREDAAAVLRKHATISSLDPR